MTALAKPNVLLICVDHWNASQLGIAGHPAILTGGLNELAQCGIRFRNAYSECPVCIPARRTLMTGQSPRAHGDRVFNETLAMPGTTTLAQAFRAAGYQADAVGKLHVYPQRDRIGFDSVLLDEEGRRSTIGLDDYDTFLGDRGFPGRQYEHGLSNNQYYWRPWHLAEELHATNWAASSMARVIKRRDPTRPAFWYLGFRHPHPPLVPPRVFVDLYADIGIDPPKFGNWAREPDSMPSAIRAIVGRSRLYTDRQIMEARRAFYALCTQIDHQIRYLIGTLHGEGILENTAILFTSDHGDMLGDHGMVAKRVFYERSANVPMILVPPANAGTDGMESVDDRLVGLQDVMPTLLDLCDIPVPDSCTGLSMLSETRRAHLYGEFGVGRDATRMIREGAFKLIYYPRGNVFQLFNVAEDRDEIEDLSGRPELADVLESLKRRLIAELYGSDTGWLVDGELRGLPDEPFTWRPRRDLHSQRGATWPPAAKT